MSLPRVLGVDGCPGGWVGVLLEPDAVAFTAGSLEGLVALVEPVACVAVDIPLGLPDSTRRQADALARTSLGARGASVFDAAVRAAYEAPSHALGSEAHRRLTGRGL
jgi:predicted RNase H-like nuclease